MTQETAPSTQPDLRKRRSTRIVQAVPLAVTGVDALGRPFQERTSTLVINCHGCRYQSKHYVLKNMWVTLEVPHPEAGNPPRAVRGRVTWIQRPRTVRELFQVGVELEIPGNFWGIAFPPADWFPFPEAAAPAIPAVFAAPSPASADQEPALNSGPASGNLVVMNSPSTEASLQLARQVARLLSEAKQQIHSSARDAAAKSVAHEARQVLDTVQAQMEKSAARAIEQAVEAHAARWLERADALIEEKSRAATEELREQWNREADARLAEARTLLSASVTSAEQTEREQFEASLGASVEAALVRLRQSAEEATARAKSASEDLAVAQKTFAESLANADRRLEEILNSKEVRGSADLDSMRAAANQAEIEIRRVAAETESSLRARTESSFAETRTNWHSQLSAAVDEAARAAAGRMDELSKRQLGEIEAHATSQMARLRQQADELQASSADVLGHMRQEFHRESVHASKLVAEVREASEKTAEFGKQLEVAQQVAKQRLEQQLDLLLDTATRTLNTRAEDTVRTIALRLQPTLDAAGAETVARIAADIEHRLQSHTDAARNSIAELSLATKVGEERMRAQQEQLTELSERTLRESAARLQESSARMSREWEEWARGSMEKINADIEARSTETSHTTFEALYKAANWYEKKAQTQMQSTLERGVQQAADALHAKAGDLSSLFASELDNFSRNFVDNAHSQLEERSTAIVQSSREKIESALDAARADAAERARTLSQEELQRFTVKLRQSFDQSAAHLEAHTAQIQAKMGADARHFVMQFQKALHEQSNAAITNAKQNLDAYTDASIEAAADARNTQQAQFKDSLERAGTESIESHKSRLESASNAWLVSSAATLNERAQKQIDDLARAAEEKLRAVFTRVFANIGESLRARLVDAGSMIPDSFLPPNK